MDYKIALCALLVVLFFPILLDFAYMLFVLPWKTLIENVRRWRFERRAGWKYRERL